MDIRTSIPSLPRHIVVKSFEFELIKTQSPIQSPFSKFKYSF